MGKLPFSLTEFSVYICIDMNRYPAFSRGTSFFCDSYTLFVTYEKNRPLKTSL